jgi:hypothetical protein
MRRVEAWPAAAVLAALATFTATARAASPVGTEFTYQGRLARNGTPVTGACSFTFRLFDAASGGLQVGSTLTHDGQAGNPPQVTVTDGLFTVALDFGAGVFTSDARWLEVEAKCAADPTYTSVGRQKLTPAPYSLSAPALQGRPVSPIAPAPGQVLQWNGSAWEPATVAGPPGPPGTPDTGCPGPRVRGVCVLQWDNTQATTFQSAAFACALAGGDICTDSQAWQIGVGSWQNLYLQETLLQGARWTASFADNDSSLWPGANGGAGDDHPANFSYGYACCGGTTPPNARVPGQSFNNVRTTYIHNIADTPFSGAAGTCAALNSDLCSDSQTFRLRQAGVLTVSTWTNSHSDNDGTLYNAINGGTLDDPHPSHNHGFACCPSLLPNDLSCPVARIVGVCAPVVHNVADATFQVAATACIAAGYDLCSVSQEAVLRSVAQLSVPTWSNSHSDNDSNNASVGVGAMPDNPLLSMSAGYACCLK